jgi:hypothetical protein
MPFTFSHPALVILLPKWKKGFFSATGLVAGSIVPDFEYFISMAKEKSQYSHSIHGVVWFDLPLAILLCFVFHGIVRDPLINHLPGRLFICFSRYRGFQWPPVFRTRWPVVIFSILLGVLSHLIWDWFTHNAIPGIEEMKTGFWFFSTYIQIYYYVVFHFFNSFMGGIVLYFVIRQLPRQQEAKRKNYVGWYWLVIIALATCIFCVRFTINSGLPLQDYGVVYLSALLIACTVVSGFAGYSGANAS